MRAPAGGSAARRPPSRKAPRLGAQRLAFRSRRFDATPVNLSLHGLAVEAEAQSRIGARLSFEVEDPNTTALLEGEVRWCTLVGTLRNPAGDVAPRYRLGIELQNGRPANYLRILRALSIGRAGES